MAAVVAVGMSLTKPTVYESSVTLLVTESKIPSVGATEPTRVGFPVETFVEMIKSRSLAQDAIRKFGFDGGPRRLTPDEFLRAVLKVEGVRRTNLIRVGVRLPDPRLSAEVANFVADKSVELNTRLNQSDTVSTRDYIQVHMEGARAELAQAQARLVGFREEAQLPRLRKEVEVLLGQRGELQARHSQVLVHLAELEASPLEARLRKAEGDLLKFRQEANLDALGSERATLRAQRQELGNRLQGVLVHLAELEASPLEARLRRAEGKLLKFRQEANLDALRAEKQILMQEMNKIAHILNSASTEMGVLGARIDQLTAQLKSLNKVETLTKSIEGEPALLAAAERAARGSDRHPLALQLRSEEFNPLYQKTEEALLASRRDLVALERRRKHLSERADQVEGRLSGLNKLLRGKEAELSRLEQERELAGAEWRRQVATSLDGARAQKGVVEAKLGENATRLGAVAKVLAEKEVQLARLTEEFNLAREEWRRQVATSRAGAKALEAVLSATLKETGERFRALRGELVAREARLEELSRAYNLAKETYQLFARKHAEASLSVASRVNELKVVDRAVVPASPVAPNVSFNAALGGSLGLIFFSFLVFFFEYLSQARRLRGPAGGAERAS